MAFLLLSSVRNILVFWAFVILVAAFIVDPTSADSTNTNNTNNNEIDGLVEWVRSKGGFFNDKIEMRRVDPNDNESPFGVFAKERLDDQELLLNVPRDCFIELDEKDVIEIDEDALDIPVIMDKYCEMTCRLYKLLAAEYKLGTEQSKYGPYIAYLQTQRRGQVPATWTKEAKDIIRKILQPGKSESYGNNILPPWEGVDWIENHFVNKGCISSDDPLEEHLLAMTVQRGYDTTLIPIWDMFNHDNGKLNTDSNSKLAAEGIKVWADRTIDAGEEIYATYDYCQDCLDTGDWVGTPGIFRDFGFVESYPQVWPFMENDIYLYVEEEQSSGEDGSTPEYSAEFYFQEVYEPTEESLDFLQSQLARLQAIGSTDLAENNGTIPQYQWDAVVQFHNSYVTALDSGIKATLAYWSSDEGSGDEL